MNDTAVNNSTSAALMNVTYSETSTLSAQVDPSFVIQMVAKLIYGILSMLFNIVVANGLQFCELYSITLYLIYAQLLGANLVNLVAESIYPPIVFLCDLTPPPWLDMFVSFVKLVAIHVTIPLEPVMAINRLICVLLPTRAMTILTPRRTIITLIGLLIYASIWASSTMFDCCRYSLKKSVHQWTYIGSAALTQVRFATGTFTTHIGFTVVCYVVILVKLWPAWDSVKRLGSDVQRKRYIIELKLLFQFLVGAAVWAGSGLLSTIGFFAGAGGPQFSLANDTLRLLWLIVHPFLYFATMGRLRSAVFGMICGKGNKSISQANAVGPMG